jgi:hypothetical protein
MKNALRASKNLSLLFRSTLLAGLCLAALPGCLLEDDSFNQLGVVDCTDTEVPRTSNNTNISMRSLTGGIDMLAQSFRAPRNMKLRAVTLNLGRTPGLVGTTSQNEAYAGMVRVQIDQSFQNLPADRLYGTATLPGKDIKIGQAPVAGGPTPFNPSTIQPYTFTFEPAIDLEANHVYWIRLSADYAPRSDLLITWASNNESRYENGRAVYSTFGMGTRWDDAILGTSRDMLFQLGCAE